MQGSRRLGSSLPVCVRTPSSIGTTDKELMIPGDFNGPLAELDGYTDRNGDLVLQLGDQLNLKNYQFESTL